MKSKAGGAQISVTTIIGGAPNLVTQVREHALIFVLSEMRNNACV